MNMVMGGETEYAISARDGQGRIFPQEALLRRFIEHAMATLGYASTSTRGRFLRNGGLLYLDAGLHIEWATPETTSPFEVVRYLEAGDRIVQGLAASLESQSPDVDGIFCSRTNVDYLSGTLWAAHESYMHRARMDELPGQLMPFLASRVILGAGGWDYRSPGLRFTISPRAQFITRPTDPGSQFVRPLFHTKDRRLSGIGTHRLHVACSESLCSQRANVLRFGTTALVLALIERGVHPGSRVALASPVAAVRRFALDPDLRASAPLGAGGRATALGIQRHYLACAEAHLDRLPFPWAEEVCSLWRATLDDLQGDAFEAQSTLDWAIKRRLFERHLQQRGIAWSSLRAWNTVLGRLRQRWAPGPRTDQEFDPAMALAPDSPMKAGMKALAPTLDRLGLSWEQLPALVSARTELFELDAKFGALGEAGVFAALDRAGALRHRLRALDVADAVRNPPRDTRARIRGDVVRRLSEEGTRYGAEWTRVYDKDRRRTLDLMDPFEDEEHWYDVSAVDAPLSSAFA
jgi:hypothetical protein